jgi:uncharacterized damage-inducible protein DinB
MTSDTVCRPFRQLARNAFLANSRLSRSCLSLAPGEWEAPRTSFFPSLKETMLHLVNADPYYIDTFRGAQLGPATVAQAGASVAAFVADRDTVDRWLLTFCEGLRSSDLSRIITIPWPDKTLQETLADALLHVFLHGQHHRGQMHAMLSGSSVAPPQIDEFVFVHDADSRAEDLAGLGWSETNYVR